MSNSAAKPPARSRLVLAAAIVLVVGAGLGVHLVLPDSAFSDIAGDVLYAVVAFLALVFVLPRLRPVMAGAISLVWCVAIEVFQLTGVPIQLAASLRPVVLVLGTVFDPRDLFVYAVAIALMTGADAAIRSIRSRHAASV